MKALTKRATRAQMVSYVREQSRLLGASQLDTLRRYVLMGAVLIRLKEETGLSSYDRAGYQRVSAAKSGRIPKSRTQKNSPWAAFVHRECNVSATTSVLAMRIARKWPTIERLPKKFKCMDDALAVLGTTRAFGSNTNTRIRGKQWQKAIPGLLNSDGPVGMLVAIAEADPDRWRRVLAYIKRNHKAVL